MNLAELPLAAVSDRFLDGAKTVVFVDEVWDEAKRGHVKRKLSISGSDLYGLPTAKDDDVLLACVQLSAIGDFHKREVHFSRYELLKLLRWADTTRNYRRLSTALRRWKGLTIYSDKAFYDHGRKSWVSRDFGIFDNLFIYEREEAERRESPARSKFCWNDVIYDSFQAGYLKRLDWDLYLSLKDPVAKRLYRFLDKRFYRQDKLVIDLHELAFNKVRMSRNYNTAQVKRAILKGIEELECMWELRRLPPDERFQKLSCGKWEAVFVRRKQAPVKKQRIVRAEDGLALELSRRGVGAAAAEGLVSKYPEERVRTMVELYDWYNSRGKERGPGFLVAGIKSAQPFVAPKGFESKEQRSTRERLANSRKRAEREIQKQREAKLRRQETAKQGAFLEFWESMGPDAQAAFESDALAQSEPTKRAGFERAKQGGGPVFEQYRDVILRDHFSRIRKTKQQGQESEMAQVPSGA